MDYHDAFNQTSELEFGGCTSWDLMTPMSGIFCNDDLPEGITLGDSLSSPLLTSIIIILAGKKQYSLLEVHGFIHSIHYTLLLVLVYFSQMMLFMIIVNTLLVLQY